MKLADIEPNPKQPRKDFAEESLRELADNVKQVGLKQPLIVKPLPTGGKFQLVDGERRYRARKLIPLEDVPVNIREDIKTEEQAAIESYIINEQRLNYNPQDKEAYIYQLKESTGLSTRKLADKLGVHHSHIDHMLEAYKFRQRLPPTLVGTLELSHSALMNTASIKDDNLRIRLLKALQDKKIKSSTEVSEIARVLKDMPRQLQEAYFADLLQWGDVLHLAKWVEVYHWIINSIMVIQQTKHLKDDIDTRIAIIDMMYTDELLKALTAGANDMDGRDKLDKLRIPSGQAPEELEDAAEQLRNAKVRAENERIENVMMAAEEEEEAE
ncbi:MAG TPA: ParB/RepB/Spo0J family partition protein [Nitrososphaeraceae archaeon]|nr:ParB/RepB/Spo0J family partition protein [Nitrososphaeraceae archaeon]